MNLVARGGPSSGVEPCPTLEQSWRSLRAREAQKETAPAWGARWFPAQGAFRATALVLHGLNLNPVKMDSVSTFLAEKGIQSLRATLTGHGGSLHAMKSVTREDWLQDVQKAYCVARGEAKGQPLFLVAFSLGALVALDAQNTPGLESLSFDRSVLFAPAIGARFFTQTVRLLGAFPFLVIPSAAPKEYRANWGTTVAAYTALFDSLSSLRAHGFARSAVPTLVFLDPEDELVSLDEVKKIQKENPFLPWKTSTFTVEPEASLKPKYHHLIIDARGAGAANWELMTKAMEEHLRPGGASP